MALASGAPSVAGEPAQRPHRAALPACPQRLDVRGWLDRLDGGAHEAASLEADPDRFRRREPGRSPAHHARWVSTAGVRPVRRRGRRGRRRHCGRGVLAAAFGGLDDDPVDAGPNAGPAGSADSTPRPAAGSWRLWVCPTPPPAPVPRRARRSSLSRSAAAGSLPTSASIRIAALKSSCASCSSARAVRMLSWVARTPTVPSRAARVASTAICSAIFSGDGDPAGTVLADAGAAVERVRPTVLSLSAHNHAATPRRALEHL